MYHRGSYYHNPTIADRWKADGLKFYIDWAAEKGYAVIDVNIPKHLTGIDVGADETPLRNAY